MRHETENEQLEDQGIVQDFVRQHYWLLDKNNFIRNKKYPVRDRGYSERDRRYEVGNEVNNQVGPNPFGHVDHEQDLVDNEQDLMDHELNLVDDEHDQETESDSEMDLDEVL